MNKFKPSIIFLISFFLCIGAFPFSCLCIEACKKCSGHDQKVAPVTQTAPCCEKSRNANPCPTPVPQKQKSCDCQCWLSKTDVYDKHFNRFSSLLTPENSFQDNLFLFVPTFVTQEINHTTIVDFHSFRQKFHTAIPIYLLNLSILC